MKTNQEKIFIEKYIIIIQYYFVFFVFFFKWNHIFNVLADTTRYFLWKNKY